MADFFQEYFVNPILYPTQYPPYNIYNTMAYALIALAAVWLIYNGLQKAGFRIDQRFQGAILPFIVFGGVFRVYEDADLTPRVVDIGGLQLYPFVTPQIYIVIFLGLSVIALASWLATKNREKTLEWVGKAGWLLSALAAVGLIVRIQHPLWAILPLALAAAAWFIHEKIREHRKLEADSFLSLMVFGQVLDGAATFVGIQFAGYAEQHVVGNILLDIGGPLLFFAVKIAFAFAAAEMLRQEKDQDARNFVALLITIFGLAPGLRDLTRAALGV